MRSLPMMHEADDGQQPEGREEPGARLLVPTAGGWLLALLVWAGIVAFLVWLF